MLPGFKAPYKWAMDDAGANLLGMAQRFGPYSFVVNTDKISRATAEDQGWDLWNDAGQRQEIRHPRIPTTGTSSISAASRGSTRSVNTLKRK